MVDVFVLEFRSELSGKIVHLDDDPANAGDEKVISKHRWDRDAERGHCHDERAGYTGRHRDEIRRAGLGHAGESAHHAPARAKQAEKGRTTDRSWEQNTLRIEGEPC